MLIIRKNLHELSQHNVYSEYFAGKEDLLVIIESIGVAVTLSGHKKISKGTLKEYLDFYQKHNLNLLYLIENRGFPKIFCKEPEVIDTAIFDISLLESIDDIESSSLDSIVFFVSNMLLDSQRIPQIMARQIGDFSLCNHDPRLSKNVTLTIPHRGDLNYLETCLRAVQYSYLNPKSSLVYLDEELTSKHLHLIKEHPKIKFHALSSVKVGPYISKNHSIENAQTQYLCFQDSDDVPTKDRFTELYSTLNSISEIGLLGSQEIRVDETCLKVFAIRYPLDVNESLNLKPCHPQLHPSTVVDIEKAKQAGGFSTVRRFASDSQFLLRCHFSMRILNLDKFLYVRRIRKGSLTTAPETQIGNKERTTLDLSWKQGFLDVHKGNTNLSNSSLAPEQLAKEILVSKITLPD